MPSPISRQEYTITVTGTFFSKSYHPSNLNDALEQYDDLKDKYPHQHVSLVRTTTKTEHLR